MSEKLLAKDIAPDAGLPPRAAAHTIAVPVACRVSIKRNVHSNDAKTMCYKKRYMKIIHYKTEMTEVGGHAE